MKILDLSDGESIRMLDILNKIKNIDLDNFIVIKVDNNDKKAFFVKYAKYYFNKYNKKNNCIGIDFEFNNRNIALAQYGFYENIDIYKGIIFIVDPNTLNYDETLKIIDTIYLSNIWKVLHGSESMDIPYVYKFLKSGKNIVKFTKKLIDTRFLCEYSKLIKKDSISNKCSIYDSLLYYNVIDDKIYENLNRLTKNMGKIYTIDWNIKNMKDSTLKYAAYDVLFLKKLLKLIKNTYTKNDINLVIQMTHYVILIKQNIIKFDIFNEHYNYYIIAKDTKKNISLQQLFAKLIDNNPHNIQTILSLQYFKSTNVVLLKNILLLHMIKYNKDTTLSPYIPRNLINVFNYPYYNILLDYFKKIDEYIEINMNNLLKSI